MKIAIVTAGIICLSMQPAAQASDGFYVNPQSTAAQWVQHNPDAPASARIRSAIANVPSALWLTGTSQTSDTLTDRINHYVSAAASADKVPMLVAYNLPHRDCSGGASAGGATGAPAYRAWIDHLIDGIGDRPAVVILEPDALADMQCLGNDKQSERLGLLNYGVSGFKQRAPHADVYLDAGNPGWKSPSVMADALNSAGVKQAHGFALNIANFYTLAQVRSYGDAINARLLSEYRYTKAIAVDTSRNGNGASPGDWCNPAGRRLGIAPQVLSPQWVALWIKLPGNSDGASSPKTDCHGGPAAGTFSAELALRLIDGN
ncbi:MULTISPECIES: glycoside hydrolase family 6 protein [unclassified Pseudomonas]|uniref:glycoside hydrolase family 6 protein n=1 Tax=unclassified Pseudomonas TaxID=196821 RepID=UPI00210F04B3|nr:MULTISPECIES: glycoside hydrolase family 6 protein [unclassified Pseudomonas]